MDDLSNAFDKLAQHSRNRAPARVSTQTADRGSIVAGRDVYVSTPPPRRPHAVRRWLDRWVIAPAAAGAGVTMAIFFVWTVIDVSTALDAGYTGAQLFLGQAATTPGQEVFGTSLSVGGPVGVAAGWAWAFLKG